MPPKLSSKPFSRAISVPAIMSPGVVSPSASDDHGKHYTRDYDYMSTPAVAVSLAFKRWKLLGLALVAIAAVALSVIFFRGGVTIKTVLLPTAKTEANEKDREELLDRYNSYTGNAAAAVTKPIEVFATMVLQLVLLRFATQRVLQPELSWRLDKFTAFAAWVLLYLLLNGFNSLNVQLKPERIESIMLASDLSIDTVTSSNSSESASSTLAKVTTVSRIVPETQPGNPITNTVLRTIVVPRVLQTPETKCGGDRQTLESIGEFVPDDGVEFGFPTRAWNDKMLPTALPVKQLTISLVGNATPAVPSDLPMNVSLAFSLYSAGVKEAQKLLYWFDEGEKPKSEALARGRWLYVPPAEYTDNAVRDLFVSDLPQQLNKMFAYPKHKLSNANPGAVFNDTERGLSVTFSHVDIAPRITFDAVTFEAAVNVHKYTNEASTMPVSVGDDSSTDDSSSGSTSSDDSSSSTTSTNSSTPRVYDWTTYIRDACGPAPASFCMVEKEQYGLDLKAYDVPSQVLALRVCTSTAASLFESNCELSNSSMLVVSIAKKFVADTIDVAWNEAKIQNAMKVYSFTAGLLRWETEDLAAAFGATCDVAGGCQGLRFPLTPAQGSNNTEVLVASVGAVPVEQLRPSDDFKVATKYTQLVLLREPGKHTQSLEGAAHMYDHAAGDVILPHNIRNASWSSAEQSPTKSGRVADGTECSALAENRLNGLLTNHLYMEDGLQPAYTSALFWLFQSGVAKTVVVSTAAARKEAEAASTTTTTTLALDGNKQISALVASIPDTNVWLSLAGCMVLAVCVIATITHGGDLVGDASSSSATTNGSASPYEHASTQLNAVAKVSDPRVIAQVMLDDSRFPPLFLDRKIVDSSGRLGVTKMKSFQIASMTLEGDDGAGAKQVVRAHHGGGGEP